MKNTGMFWAGFFTAIGLSLVGAYAPPILPFTEISDEKMAGLKSRMVKAKDITLEDCKVVLQLEHQWLKGIVHRERFYALARSAKEGEVVNAKDLGRLWDRVDKEIEDRVEEALQKAARDAAEKDAKGNGEGLKRGREA